MVLLEQSGPFIQYRGVITRRRREDTGKYALWRRSRDGATQLNTKDCQQPRFLVRVSARACSSWQHLDLELLASRIMKEYISAVLRPSAYCILLWKFLGTLGKDLGYLSTTVCQGLRAVRLMAKESHAHSSSGLSDTDRAAFLGSRRVLRVETPTWEVCWEHADIVWEVRAELHLRVACKIESTALDRTRVMWGLSRAQWALAGLKTDWAGAAASRSQAVWGPLLTASREKENKILPTTRVSLDVDFFPPSLQRCAS